MLSADFLLNVPLMSKARPRMSRRGGRVYMPASYVQWKDTVRALLGEWWTEPPLDKVICLALTFNGPARGDLDNLAGAVLDSGNGLVWRDDRVGVISSMALRWKKTTTTNQSIYMKVIWQ